MNTGKVSNTILKRSVLNRIGSSSPQLVDAPAVGHDCGVIAPPDFSADGPEVLSCTACGLHPVYKAANNIAVCGGQAVAAQCAIVLPPEAAEAELRAIAGRLAEDCKALGMVLSGGHTRVSAAVKQPVITVTGIGYRPGGSRIGAALCRPGQEVVMTKWVGTGGIGPVIERSRAQLEKRFRPEVLQKAAGRRPDLSVATEAALARRHGVSAMHDVSESGIFGALWDFAEAGRVGLEIDFGAILVCQEVIEVCETLEINPYEFDSTGCLLMTTKNGYDIVNIFRKYGIPAGIIGRTTAGKDRIIRNQDEVRYLEPPKQDALYRFLE